MKERVLAKFRRFGIFLRKLQFGVFVFFSALAFVNWPLLMPSSQTTPTQV